MMKEYIVSLITAALVAALIGVLSPEGEGGGLSRHMRLLCTLFLLCVIVAPLGGALGTLSDALGDTLAPPDANGGSAEDYQAQLDEALSSAAKPYFAELLIKSIEKEFSIPTGEVRCAIRWGEESPERISIILSGSAIWQDPAPIEQFVRETIGCECVSAIE